MHQQKKGQENNLIFLCSKRNFEAVSVSPTKQYFLQPFTHPCSCLCHNDRIRTFLQQINTMADRSLANCRPLSLSCSSCGMLFVQLRAATNLVQAEKCMGFAISITKHAKYSNKSPVMCGDTVSMETETHFRTKGSVSAIISPFKVRGTISHTKRFPKLRLPQLVTAYHRGMSKNFRCSLCPNNLNNLFKYLIQLL